METSFSMPSAEHLQAASVLDLYDQLLYGAQLSQQDNESIQTQHSLGSSARELAELGNHQVEQRDSDHDLQSALAVGTVADETADETAMPSTQPAPASTLDSIKLLTSYRGSSGYQRTRASSPAGPLDAPTSLPQPASSQHPPAAGNATRTYASAAQQAAADASATSSSFQATVIADGPGRVTPSAPSAASQTSSTTPVAAADAFSPLAAHALQRDDLTHGSAPAIATTTTHTSTIPAPAAATRPGPAAPASAAAITHIPELAELAAAVAAAPEAAGEQQHHRPAVLSDSDLEHDYQDAQSEVWHSPGASRAASEISPEDLPRQHDLAGHPDLPPAMGSAGHREIAPAGEQGLPAAQQHQQPAAGGGHHPRGSQAGSSRREQSAAKGKAPSAATAAVQQLSKLLSLLLFQLLPQAWQLLSSSLAATGLGPALGHALRPPRRWLGLLLLLALRVLARVASWLMFPLGVAMSYWYHRNRAQKAHKAALLRADFSNERLAALLGHLPSWLAAPSDTERAAWLNTLLADVWPVLDPVACGIIKAAVEPLVAQFAPPFISRIGFRRLSLGDVPLTVEGIRVPPPEHQEPGQVLMDIDFAWASTMDVALYVELALLGGHYRRMVPQVRDVAARGTARIILRPLVPVAPGVGAVLVSLLKAPRISFRLDFGVFGSSWASAPVASFLEPFIRETLGQLLVWPCRLVVPLLGEDVTGPVEELELRTSGVMEVTVGEARGLQGGGGWLSRAHPQVELFMRPQNIVLSSTKRGSHSVRWRETHEVTVQEPSSQMMHVTVYDVGGLSPGAMLSSLADPFADSSSWRSRQMMGRTALPVAQACAQPGVAVQGWHRLTRGDWSSTDVELAAQSAGELHLSMLYRPFLDLATAQLHPVRARGVLLVSVRGCRNLVAGDWDGGTDPYVLLKVGKESKRTLVAFNSHAPVFNTSFEFFNVTGASVLKVQVWDRDFLKPDDYLGGLSVPVRSVLEGSNPGGPHGTVTGWFRLHGVSHGEVELRLRFMAHHSGL